MKLLLCYKCHLHALDSFQLSSVTPHTHAVSLAFTISHAQTLFGPTACVLATIGARWCKREWSLNGPKAEGKDKRVAFERLVAPF
jgi:hypothetical protein